MKARTLLAASFWFLSTVPALAGSSISSHGSQIDKTGVVGSSVPEGLAPDDWAGIRAAYEAGRYAIYAGKEGHQARSHDQGWRAQFDGRGVILNSDRGGWGLGLQLARYGFEGALVDVESANRVRPDGQLITYDWNAGLSEWWINDQRGLEHGYSLHERPRQTGDREQGPLVLDLLVQGDLRPIGMASGQGVRMIDELGKVIWTYDGLVAFDADGVLLESWLEVTDVGLRIAVLEDGARYPLTVDPLVQSAFLTASNPSFTALFGEAVSVSGNTVVVGAIGEDSDANNINGNQADTSANQAGAAYVFVCNGGVWTQQAYLKASNSGQNDRFGGAVSISGDTVVVGARGEDSNATGVNGDQFNNFAPTSGAAYVFVRTGTTWMQQAYLKASNTESVDRFGDSVAVSGDILVVGTPFEDSNAVGVNGNQADNSESASGAAYVFARTGSTWSQEAYLKASNTGDNDSFGTSLAVSGETVVIGAPVEASNSKGVNGDQANDTAFASGAAYVFVRSGGMWSQQAYLKSSNPGGFDRFGNSVAVDGNSVIVGAPGERSNATGVDGNQGDNSAPDAGAAYVFVRSGGIWTQQAYLKASNTDENDSFGVSVGLSGDRVVVGASGEDSSATGIDGNQANNGTLFFDAGAAYVFSRSTSVWSQLAYLKASNSGDGDLFGIAVALSADTTIIGALGEDSGDTNSGAAYIFDLLSPGIIGSNICAPAVVNSTGVPAEMSVTGFESVAANQLTLNAANLPTGMTGFFLTSQTQGMIQNPGGSQGTLCLGGAIGRFNAASQIQNSGPLGVFSLPIDLTQIPQPAGQVSILAGDTWTFQAWYRDNVAGQSTSNFTNGVEITFSL